MCYPAPGPLCSYVGIQVHLKSTSLVADEPENVHVLNAHDKHRRLYYATPMGLKDLHTRVSQLAGNSSRTHAFMRDFELYEQSSQYRARMLTAVGVNPNSMTDGHLKTTLLGWGLRLKWLFKGEKPTVTHVSPFSEGVTPLGEGGADSWGRTLAPEHMASARKAAGFEGSVVLADGPIFSEAVRGCISHRLHEFDTLPQVHNFNLNTWKPANEAEFDTVYDAIASVQSFYDEVEQRMSTASVGEDLVRRGSRLNPSVHIPEFITSPRNDGYWDLFDQGRLLALLNVTSEALSTEFSETHKPTYSEVAQTASKKYHAEHDFLDNMTDFEEGLLEGFQAAMHTLNEGEELTYD